MQSGLDVNNPLVADAFRAVLRQQLFIIAAIFLLLWLGRLIAASWWPQDRPPRGRRPGLRAGAAGVAGPEPVGRLALRVGFGIIWIFDGILQAQPAMPLGLTSQVIEPTAAGSPGWVRHVVNWAGTSWTYHPIQISAAAVWIQVGIGLWLVFARHGLWSRVGALVSVGWGLVVWVFGESFGGIFAPGLTWLFGAPGAVLFYCAAGALLALPESAWRNPRLGRGILAGMGAFFLGMAVLQAWPGRGFWQGTVHGHPGTLTGMLQQMAQTPQPRGLASIVRAFAGFVAAHGFAVNLFSVVALVVIGAAFVSGRPRLARIGVVAGVVLCLADWVLVEDLGFLGGLGTDPNSMIPMALLFVSGYLVLTRSPDPEAAAAPAAAAPAAPSAPAPPMAAAAPTAAAGPGNPAGPGVPAGPGSQAGPGVPAGPGSMAGPGNPAGPGSPAGPEAPAAPAPGPAGWYGRLASWLLSAGRALAAASAGSIAAVGALAVTLVGVLPAAAASANPNADPIIAQAIDGTSGPADYPAAAFTLTDQRGATVSLASLRGKVVLLTFLDPVCTNDCPLIGREFAAAGRLLAADSRQVVLAAVVASRTYRSLPVMQAYDRQEGLSQLPDWLYLTGTVAQLSRVWHDYAVAVQTLPAGAMTLHSDIAYAIDRDGRVRQILEMDPGPGTAASQSSFAVQLTDAARQLLGAR